MSTPAGWYPDPYDSSQQRWWNGMAWGDQTHVAQPPSGSPQYETVGFIRPQHTMPTAGYQGVPVSSSLASFPVVSPWGRLGAHLLEGLLVLITLGIGWLFWAATLADKGQTPAKKMLGQRVIMDYTGAPASFGRMLFLRGFVAGFVANWAILFTLGIILFMPFWDSKNRNLWDHLSSTRVVYDHSG